LSDPVKERLLSAPGAVVVLLALAGLGLAARPRVTLTFDPVLSGWPAILAALMASAAWVLAATAVFARTSAHGDVRRAFRRAFLMNLGLLSAAWFVLVGLDMGGAAQKTSRLLPPVMVDQVDWNLWFDFGGTRWLFGAIVAAVVVTGVVLLARMAWSIRLGTRRRRAELVRRPRFGRGAHGSATPEDIREAVVRARRALLGADDARRAIIAAYAAMERSVAGHGVDRRPSQTPAEFLHEALDGGVLHDRAAATRLLRLFECARFSHEELPADAVVVAADALDALQADVDRAGVVP
jgi:Domain of unknown function (DUF4129)